MFRFRHLIPLFAFLPALTFAQPASPNPHAELMNHQVYCAVGASPATLAIAPTFLIEKASVPDAVPLADGDYLYYVNAEPGKHGIYVARVTKTAIEFLGPVLIDGVYNGNAVDPDVVLLPDGRIRLYYFDGYFTGPRPPMGIGKSLNPIYSAISTDGRNFTREGKVFELEGIADPSVVTLSDGSLLMACSRGERGMQLARSQDGKTFSALPISFERGIPELTVNADGSVQLVYNVRGGLASYRSTDNGTTWNKDPDLYFAYSKPIADPSIIQDQYGCRLYFKGFKSPPGAGNPGQPVTPGSDIASSTKAPPGTTPSEIRRPMPPFPPPHRPFPPPGGHQPPPQRPPGPRPR